MSVELDVKYFVRYPSVVDDAVATALRWRDPRSPLPLTLSVPRYGVPPAAPPANFSESTPYVSPAVATGQQAYVEERWYQQSITPTFYKQGRSIFCLVDIMVNRDRRTKFRFEVDTGSSITWLFSNLIPPNGRPKGTYDPSRAIKFYSAQKEPGSKLPAMGSPVQFRGNHPTAHTITYVDGSFVDYNLHADDFLLKTSLENSAWTEAWVPVSFGATKRVTLSQFRESPFDGLMGFGLGRSAVSPFLETLLRNNIMTMPIVTFSLQHDKIHLGTEMHLHGQTSQWKGPVPLTARMTISSGMKVVGNTRYTSTLSTAVLDTGASFVYLSDEVVTAFYERIPNAFFSDDLKAYVIPKTSLSRCPPFRLQIGREFVIFRPDLLAGPDVEGSSHTFVEGAIQSVKSLHLRPSEEVWGMPVFKCVNLKFHLDTSKYPDTEYGEEYNKSQLYWTEAIIPH